MDLRLLSTGSTWWDRYAGFSLSLLAPSGATSSPLTCTFGPQVKEKETARKEYKQAVERGHGAYLMDQDAPVRPASARQAEITSSSSSSSAHFSIWCWLSLQDVFTISVGNLPPAATVLIKVTFVSELIVKDGSILFSLPGSVAPWQESAALNQTTQASPEPEELFSIRPSHPLISIFQPGSCAGYF